MVDLHAWVLLPPVLAITLAIVTRRVHQSLLLGILTAGFLAGWAALPEAPSGFGIFGGILIALADGVVQSVEWLVGAVANPGNAAIFTFILMLGGIVGLLQRSGAMRGFAERALSVTPGRRSAQFLAWLTGATVLAIDDHFNVITSGTLFRPLTDKLRISREKLAYLIDSTGSPIAIINPVSTWAGFMIAFTGGALATVGATDVSAFGVFLRSIPWNLYAWATLVFVFLVAVTGRDRGPMLHAEQRAAAGHVIRPGARPLASDDLHVPTDRTGTAADLLLPLLFLAGTAVLMLWAIGHEPGMSFRQSMANTNAPLSLAVATFLALSYTFFRFLRKGMMTQDDAVEAVVAGGKAMVPALIILGMAFALGAAVQAIGLGQWVASAVGGNVTGPWLPAVLFIVSAVMAFATGTSFGTYAIMIPLGMGIAAQLPDPAAWYAPALAAISGGGVFGDHCSPISDTTVLSSMAAHCDHVDHVRTQLPYALATAGAAGIGYAAIGFGAPILVAFVVPLLLVVGLFVVPARQVTTGSVATGTT